MALVQFSVVFFAPPLPLSLLPSRLQSVISFCSFHRLNFENSASEMARVGEENRRRRNMAEHARQQQTHSKVHKNANRTPTVPSSASCNGSQQHNHPLDAILKRNCEETSNNQPKPHIKE
ncbi:hypothetical protein niasHT_024235 [Heterodera trifolii]|uniref:Uncharacterized protein n=1 Tax=Heterodera trifolii TaxID=157864 RepID=A0ABD2JM14_9BILA